MRTGSFERADESPDTVEELTLYISRKDIEQAHLLAELIPHCKAQTSCSDCVYNRYDSCKYSDLHWGSGYTFKERFKLDVLLTGHSAYWCRIGLIVDDKWILAKSKPKWRQIGKSKWYYYKTIEELCSKYFV